MKRFLAAALLLGQVTSVAAADVNNPPIKTPSTRQVLTSGTSYTRPTNPAPIQIIARYCGGGGGGQGSGTAGAGLGGAGTATTFNGISANPGNGATPGSALANSATIFSMPGTAGGGGTVVTGTDSTPGGVGAGSAFFGGGGYAVGTAGSSAGGGGGPTNGTGSSGAGGASGACVSQIINNPAASYAYTLGAAGAAGTAGTSGNAGYAAGTTSIVVDEYYQ